MDPKIFVRELEPGEVITSFFAVRKKEMKETRGGPMLLLELGDKSGRLSAPIFNDPVRAHHEIEIGDVVKVQALVGTYNDALQLRIERLRRAESGEFDIRDFLRAAERSAEELLAAYRVKAESIHHPYLRELLARILDDAAFMERLAKAPAGKLWHHDYVGGLIEHTLSVATLCERAAELYSGVDRDLLLAGALLHDIGKVWELSTTTFIDYTDAGRLVGHIVIGERHVREMAAGVPNFPVGLLDRLSHLILSHQGTRDHGSPVPAMTLEAFILAGVDDLDSKVGAVSRIIEKERSEGKRWSAWVNLLDRFIYLGDAGAGPDQDAG